jgi:hypothetical protein
MEQLMQVNAKLDEKDKALQNVSRLNAMLSSHSDNGKVKYYTRKLS